MNRADLQIEFRPIEPGDAVNLVRWQRQPDVEVWWGDAEKSDGELKAKWVQRADGSGSEYDRNTNCYIIVVDGTDIGEIQGYDLRHYPVENAEVGFSNAGGVDLFIGEPTWRDRGVGTAVLRKFVDDVIFAMPGIEICTIDPDPQNKRAIRSYEKAGFVYAKSYFSEANKMNCYLMTRERPSK